MSTNEQDELSDILAWLNTEQRKANRWFRGDRGIYQFGLTGPELMRVRHALGESDGEWQCRFVADQKCCALPRGHTGQHIVGEGQ
jgi:hypothetical protein